MPTNAKAHSKIDCRDTQAILKVRKVYSEYPGSCNKRCSRLAVALSRGRGRANVPQELGINLLYTRASERQLREGRVHEWYVLAGWQLSLGPADEKEFVWELHMHVEGEVK
jgi:hypothetical protein